MLVFCFWVHTLIPQPQSDSYSSSGWKLLSWLFLWPHSSTLIYSANIFLCIFSCVFNPGSKTELVSACRKHPDALISSRESIPCLRSPSPAASQISCMPSLPGFAVYTVKPFCSFCYSNQRWNLTPLKNSGNTLLLLNTSPLTLLKAVMTTYKFLSLLIVRHFNSWDPDETRPQISPKAQS